MEKYTPVLANIKQDCVRIRHTKHFNMGKAMEYDMSNGKNEPAEISSQIQHSPPWHKRQDLWTWVSGMLFIIVLSGAIMGIGNARGWYAPNGYTHNVSVTSQERFLPEPFVEEPGVHGRHGSGRTSRWYYWKLPPVKVTAWTRTLIWVCYCTHQIFIWTVLYIAQIKKASSTGPRYSTNMSKYNWIAFGGNIFFHLLHLLQTHTTYDALAQDVHVTSSQGSVIMLIVYVILIEYRDRGLFFGWPSRRDNNKCSTVMRLSYNPLYIARKYHGYVFSWAAIYTFWYHPMENTIGHVMGFVHTWMIMLQGSLFYTNFHLNKWWRFVVETWVTLHAAVIAWQTGGPTVIWPMFLCGFALLVCVTQIYSFQFWWKIHAAFRVVPFLIYTAMTLVIYGMVPGKSYSKMYEICFIPLILILLPLVCHGLLLLCLKIEECCQRIGSNAEVDIHDTKTPAMPRNINVSTARRVVFTILAFFMLGMFVFAGWAIEYFDTPGELFVWMNVLCTLYSIGVVIFAMLIKQAIPMDIYYVPIK